MFVCRWLRHIPAILFLVAAAASQSAAERGAAIDRWLESQVAEGFRGQLLLERDGDVVLDRAFGLADEAKAAAATTSTLYYIGSLAKMSFHDGGMPGFHALFGRFPDERAVVIVLGNRDEAAGAVGRRLAQELFRE